MQLKKIINDPVYGFITIDDELVFKIIAHPYYQRLRRISQMAMANLVYPGAVHTRLHHSLGAYHLMCNALSELKNKGIEISKEEEQGAKVAILLHDIGHGAFSHVIETILGFHHEDFTIEAVESRETEVGRMLREYSPQLPTDVADIIRGTFRPMALAQLVSSQLDVDRMDYLLRDSLMTGVKYGVLDRKSVV